LRTVVCRLREGEYLGNNKECDDSIDTLSAKLIELMESNPIDAFEIGEMVEAVGGRQLEIWVALDAWKQPLELIVDAVVPVTVFH
jgi:hypothetical protein